MRFQGHRESLLDVHRKIRRFLGDRVELFNGNVLAFVVFVNNL